MTNQELADFFTSHFGLAMTYDPVSNFFMADTGSGPVPVATVDTFTNTLVFLDDQGLVTSALTQDGTQLTRAQYIALVNSGGVTITPGAGPTVTTGIMAALKASPLLAAGAVYVGYLLFFRKGKK